VQVSEFYFVPH